MAVPGVRARLVRDHLGAHHDAYVDSQALPPLLPGSVGHDPAAYVAAGWVTGGLLLAAWLHRGGHRSMCSVIRTPPGLLGLAVFLAHLARVWGRYDPFDFASSHIHQRTP